MATNYQPPAYDPRAEEIINFLTNLNPDTRDPDTASAESAIFGGGFSGARQYRERDLDRRARFQESVPFLNMRQSAQSQSQSEAARERLVAQEGVLAQQRQESEHRQQLLLDAGRQAAQQGNMELADRFNKEAAQLKLQGELTMQAVGLSSDERLQQQRINAASQAQQLGFQHASSMADKQFGYNQILNRNNGYDQNATVNAANSRWNQMSGTGGGGSGTGAGVVSGTLSQDPVYNPISPGWYSGTGEYNMSFMPAGSIVGGNVITGNTQSEGSGEFQAYDSLMQNNPYGNIDTESGA